MDALISLALISGSIAFLACFFLAQLLAPRRSFQQRLADALWLGLLAFVGAAALALPFLG